jgi:multidrug efflux pump subunit AcrB
MDIARYAIEKPVNTWMIVIAALIGGLWGLLTVGRLEDPAFTIKLAQVITQYPGATAQEVELEVTERLETAIQQMPQLHRITSTSKPGMSQIEVEIKDTYGPNDLPQVWDELRRKVSDEQARLPAGVRAPQVIDDFGDVFGLFYAFTAEGYSRREIRQTIKSIRRELLAVPGVGKVEVAGERQDNIYLYISQDRLAQLGISLSDVVNTLGAENAVQDSGSDRSGDLRIRINPATAFSDYSSISELVIGNAGTTATIRLLDIARLDLAEPEMPDQLIRYNGVEAVTFGVAQVRDANIVVVGDAVKARLEQIQQRLPVGMTIHPIYEQNVVVDEAVNGFIVNLAMSVAIVIAVLCLFMGWRAGVVVGTVLLLTVLATVFMMRIFGIEMERISLGALIIAMGMLVDNAIVVAEGMLINMQRGQPAIPAASAAVRQTKWPLLGATIIGIMAFSGIGLSPDSTGEFLFSLFAIIGISLLLSWVFAVTVTPLFGKYLFRERTDGGDDDPYRGVIYEIYRRLLRASLRLRLVTILALVAITGACFVGFGSAKQAFFPDSNTPLFYVHYWMPQGRDIRAVDRDLRKIEEWLIADDRVSAVTSFAGQGALRFMLTYNPELPNPSYGHLVVRTKERATIAALSQELRAWAMVNFPDAQLLTEDLVFGPPAGAKIEARFSGPDPDALRRLGEQAETIMRSPEANLRDIRNDWRQREIVIQPVFDEARARIAGVTRSDLGQALLFSTVGIEAGNYRDGDETIPIIARRDYDEGRSATESLSDTLVWSAQQRAYVPVEQIVSSFVTEAEDTLIKRRNRVRTLTVRANTVGDETAAAARDRLAPMIEALALPPSYALEWGGEYEATNDAQASLGAQLPLGFLVMLVISILLFAKLRQPLIIWLMVPMSVNGVAIALLATDTAFSFLALLGLLSLSGMLIKNAIVLLDEIDSQIDSGKERFAALVDASTSRLRPVTLAAVTTILGMAPLLFDAFFVSMAVTFMGGLAFATILTLIAAPVLYALFFGIRPSGVDNTAPESGEIGKSAPVDAASQTLGQA